MGFLLFLALALTGCASNRVNPLLSQEIDFQLSASQYQKSLRELDQLWQKRDQLESVQKLIEQSQKILRSKHAQRAFYTRLSHAYFIQAEYFDLPENEKKTSYEAGANAAEYALTFNSEFKERLILRKQPTEVALKSLKRDDADALYWHAVNLGRWATSQGLSTSVKNKDRIKRMLDWISKNKPSLHWGGVDRYYGTYFALAPGMSQSDLKLSERHFQSAIKKFPNYLGNYYYFLKYYGAKVEDPKIISWVENKTRKILSKKGLSAEADFAPEQKLESLRLEKLFEEFKTANH